MDAILQIVVLIFSTVLHEVSHGYVAYALGDPTAKFAGRLTLNPIAHLELFGSFIVPIAVYVLSQGTFIYGWAKPVPYNPYNLKGGKWGPTIVALSGPLTNLLLAFVFGLVVRFTADSLPVSFLAIFAQVAYLIVIINCVLGVFNLIPVPPLDGSKVLLALFPRYADRINLFFMQYQWIVFALIIIVGWRVVALPASFLVKLFTGIAF